MSKRSRKELKDIFQRRANLSQENFEAVFESFVSWKDEVKDSDKTLRIAGSLTVGKDLEVNGRFKVNEEKILKTIETEKQRLNTLKQRSQAMNLALEAAEERLQNDITIIKVVTDTLSILESQLNDSFEHIKGLKPFRPAILFLSVRLLKGGRNRATSSTIGNKIYIFGGRNDSEELNTIEVFDPENKEEPCKIILNAKLSDKGGRGFTSCTMGNKIYIFGGVFGREKDKLYSYNIQEFNHEKESCTTLKHIKLSDVRAYGSSSVIGSKIYIFGGESGNGNYLDTIETFDPENEKEPCKIMLNTKLSEKKRELTSCTIGNKIYIFGGKLKNKFKIIEASGTIEVFDPSIGICEPITDIRLFTPRYGHTSCAIGNKIYIFGGRNGSGELDTIEEFDPEGRKCEVIGTLSENKAYCSSSVIGNKIYILGGVRARKTLDTIDVFIPELWEKD